MNEFLDILEVQLLLLKYIYIISHGIGWAKGGNGRFTAVSMETQFILVVLFITFAHPVFSSWLEMDSTSVVCSPIAPVLLGSFLEMWNLRPTPGLLNHHLYFI